jgi:anti-anti-sigma factor
MSPSPAFPLSWSSHRVGSTSTTLTSIRGEIDALTAPGLRDHLDWLLSSGAERIIVDAHGVDFVDAGAHHLLAELGRRGQACGCAVVICSPSPPVRRVLALLGTPDGVTVEDLLLS